MPRKAADLTGQKFNRLTVIELSGKNKWLCRCDCGNTTSVVGWKLQRNHTKSCGCYQKEVRAKNSIKHGMSYTTEYTIWRGIVQRCTNPNYHQYELYGGRGIQMCDRWRNSFDDFFSDMGPRPSKKHSIDRKDNDGNYEPSNCCWATIEEQNRNRRFSKMTHPPV